MRKEFWLTYILVGLIISLKYYNKNLEIFPAVMSLYSLIGFGIYMLDKEILSIKNKQKRNVKIRRSS